MTGVQYEDIKTGSPIVPMHKDIIDLTASLSTTESKIKWDSNRVYILAVSTKI